MTFILDMVTGQCQYSNDPSGSADTLHAPAASQTPGQLLPALQEYTSQPGCETGSAHGNAVLVYSLREILKDTE